MGHVDDKWHRRVNGRRVRSAKHGKNPKSRWAVRWIDPGGNEKQRSFETEEAAKTWLRRVENQLESGQYVDPKKGAIPVGDYAERWYRSKATKTSTLRDYRSALDAHVLPRWRNVAVARITDAEIREWVGDLRRVTVRRRLRRPTGELVKDAEGRQVFEDRPLSAARVRRAHLVLECVLDFAKADRAIYSNPAEGTPLPKMAKKQARSVGAERFRSLQEKLAEHGPDTEVLVAVLATTGIRWSEAVGLDVHDLVGRQLHVRRPQSEVAGRLVADTPKGHRDRYVTLPPSLLQPVSDLIGARSEGPLFRGPRGGRWRKSTWTRRWERATEAAGLPGLTPHECRHLYASEAIARGADLKKLQRQLGHASATLTLDTYGHWLEQGTDEIADAMDDIAMPVTKRDNESTQGASELPPDLATERDDSAGTGGARVAHLDQDGESAA